MKNKELVFGAIAVFAFLGLILSIVLVSEAKAENPDSQLPFGKKIVNKETNDKKGIEYFVSDGDEVITTISSEETNRIALYNDRIASVVAGNNKVWQIDHNKATGDVYLTPKQDEDTPSATAPLNLFVTSEKKFTYKLLLLPESSPSQQMVLWNGSIKEKRNPSDSNSQKYFETLSEEIKTLATSGIEVLGSKESKLWLLGYGYELYVSKIIPIDGYQYHVGAVKNIGEKDLTLSPDIFRASFRRAVWYQKDKLNTNEFSPFVLVTQGEK